MKILGTAGNGTITQAIKTYDELSDKEKAVLVIPATSQVSDYETFLVNQNKHGEKLNVKPRKFTEEWKQNRYLEDIREGNLLDSLTIKYGNLVGGKGARRRIKKAKERNSWRNKKLKELD